MVRLPPRRICPRRVRVSRLHSQRPSQLVSRSSLSPPPVVDPNPHLEPPEMAGPRRHEPRHGGPSLPPVAAGDDMCAEPKARPVAFPGGTPHGPARGAARGRGPRERLAASACCHPGRTGRCASDGGETQQDGQDAQGEGGASGTTGLRARPPPSSRLHAAAPLAHQPARAAPMTIGRRSRGTRVVG